MGLFSNNKKLCPICGESTPRLFPTKVEGTPICKACANKVDLPNGVLDQMNLVAFRGYISFHDNNRSLRESFQKEFTYDVDGWSDQIEIDLSKRLFRVKDKDNAIVFEASCIQSFQIMEDDRVLLEGDKSGMRVYPSQVPGMLRDLEPSVTRHMMERREYERLKRMYDMMDEREEDEEKKRNRPYLHEPRFTGNDPVTSFRINMTLDHPYWPTFEGEVYGPRFDAEHPSTTDYLSRYQKEANKLAELAKNLMRIFAPGTPVRKAGESNAASQQPAAPAAVPGDAVTEIQRYKALMDAGVITQEEFTAKKRQLLGI